MSNSNDAKEPPSLPGGGAAPPPPPPPPPVLSRRPTPTASDAENPSTTTTTTTTATTTATVTTSSSSKSSSSMAADLSSKIITTTTATAVSASSTQVTTTTVATSAPSSGKCIAITETKKTAANSGGNTDTTSSSSSTPQQTPRPRRKPTSRSKKDADDKNKSSSVVNVSSAGVQMVPQTPLMLTSAPPGQFMIVQHNGQCYVMSATQYFGSNQQQIAAVRPHQQQQQVQSHVGTLGTSCTNNNSITGTTGNITTTVAQDFLKTIHQQQQQQNSTNTFTTVAQQYYSSSQQQYRHVQTHQMHSQQQQQQQQQQYVQPGIVANSATLGQLARSLAPKPTLPGLGSVTVSVSNTTQPSSPATSTVTSTTSSLGQAGSDTTSVSRSTLQQQHQLCAAPVHQIQPSMFPQGIQLRTPQGSSGIVFQMPSGAYTYVHQLVTPQQRSSSAVPPPPQLPQIPACIGQAVSSSQPQQQQQQQLHAAAATPPISKATNLTLSQQTKSKNQIASSNSTGESSIIERSAGNASPVTKKGPGQTPKGNETQQPKSTKGSGGKHSGGSRKSANTAVKIATPQPLAPANLVPVGAPVPMMVMSTAMPQLGSFPGPTAVPFVGPNGQIIHQQLIANTPIPTHQMIPVFQHQQQQQQTQNSTHFAIAQPPTVPGSDANSQNSHKPPPLATGTDDDGGFTDSGIENEPPPLLVQGESKDALDIHMMFTREAERYYQRAGRKGKIVHLIEGFEIEESDEPFPCEPPCRLSDWLLSEVEEKETVKPTDESPRTTSPKKAVNEKDTETVVEVEAKTEKSEIKKGRAKSSPTKSESSSEKTGKKTRKRKTNELDRLLQMDFGPAHGRLCDILQKSSVYKGTTKEGVTAKGGSSTTKCKGRPQSAAVSTATVGAVAAAAASSSSLSTEKQKVEKDEPVMERFIIEDAVDGSQKTVSNNFQESPITVEPSSLNTSSKSSGGDTVTGSFLTANFSDEELDTERCNYCNGLLRLKRLENHPQYCSKKCRKLWKKNPALSEEQVVRSFNASPRLTVAHSADTLSSTVSKEVSPIIPTMQNLTVISEPSSSDRHKKTVAETQSVLSPKAADVCPSTKGVTSSSEPQQRSPPTLTLKMVSPQQAEIVKSPRASSVSYQQGECSSKLSSTSVSPTAAASEKVPVDFMSKATKTWTCDEVAIWVASVTGNEDCANTFRNQDIDGQSLLLLADNAHHNLGTLLGLKLGPVVKILNALKELCAKSINVS